MSDLKESLNTSINNSKQKLKSINYEAVIDRYFTNRNILIAGGLIVFLIILISIISATTGSNRNEINISKLELIETQISKLHQQQKNC